ncbi:MAG: hypothetical protein ACI815_002644, partial [Psychroserpens sp.]
LILFLCEWLFTWKSKEDIFRYIKNQLPIYGQNIPLN